MTSSYTPELPVARVVMGGHIVKTFVGAEAIEAAQDFIGSMPGHEDGRFGIDVSDDYCPACGATFSAEAWDEGDKPDEWHCPECDALKPPEYNTHGVCEVCTSREQWDPGFCIEQGHQD